ncbi:hypothetical protein [Vibrio vulnificus YJ016]|uniref:Uncharacterized protein n=1 Tax=Vibrio vulnificus (strain YJ016) TaxID=196600 RepID=Q7MFZ4_VIBVY|nr:hypothetical protein [Vibrio vulnificus]PWY31519.1 hypothetical protein VV86_18895 [Vibrio vulnificus]BAC96201.1 hypothetical protein [Vibrio vulnificus YJ016]
MLFVKIFKLCLLVVSICLATYLAAASFLGPGVKDQSISLLGGYRYLDAGHYEKQIVYIEADKRVTIVIDARVDDYLIKDDVIYLARRPREIYNEDGIVKSRVSDVCEYWKINSHTGDVSKIESIAILKCR